jgi:hypothetical protein
MNKNYFLVCFIILVGAMYFLVFKNNRIQNISSGQPRIEIISPKNNASFKIGEPIVVNYRMWNIPHDNNVQIDIDSSSGSGIGADVDLVNQTATIVFPPEQCSPSSAATGTMTPCSKTVDGNPYKITATVFQTSSPGGTVVKSTPIFIYVK